MTENPLVSVVIPTYGRPEFLRNCVRAAIAQRCNFGTEFLVVDDGGEPPASLSLAEISDPRLRIVRTANGGPAKARNEGVRQARGQYVAFVDDDCVPEDGWLQAALDAFDDGVATVHGFVRPPRPASPLAYHFIETGNAAADVTANLIVRRDALLKIGGFDEGFPYAAGEDFDLCWRLQRIGAARFAPDARVVHVLIPITWQKRRSRPRVWTTFFRLYALHPERARGLRLPGLQAIGSAVLDQSPPVWIGVYLMLAPFSFLARNTRGCDWLSLVSEFSASCLNVLDAIRSAPAYLRAYKAASAEGGRPGLGLPLEQTSSSVNDGGH